MTVSPASAHTATGAVVVGLLDSFSEEEAMRHTPRQALLAVAMTALAPIVRQLYEFKNGAGCAAAATAGLTTEREMKRTALIAAASAVLAACAALEGGNHDMTFFVTSTGKGNGANLGGVEGADAHCNALAQAAGSKHTNWKAYLSTVLPGGDAGVSARERIGKGPWYNAKGVMVAKSLDDLHSDHVNITKQTALDEKGQPVKGRGEQPNEHDILTGSDPEGRFSTAGGDTTCGNWTKSGDGSAIVGHHDRAGLKDTRHMNSWNSSHGSRGCSQDALKSSGGAGLLYCFRTN